MVVWGIPLALLCISLAWCPKIFQIVIEPATATLSRGGTMLDIATSSKSARGKATVITSLWKLLLIPFVAASFCRFYDIADLTKLSKGFQDFNADHSAFPYFMTQIITSFVGCMLAILACSMCMQFLAFAFPMTLATPISVALAVMKHSPDNDVPHFTSGDASNAWLYVIGICFLFAQFLSVGYYVFKGQDFIMAKESSLFWMPTYNGREI